MALNPAREPVVLTLNTPADQTMRAVFLDKDGTLIEDIPFNVDPCRIRLTPNAGAGLRMLRDAGFAFIVVSNQAGVAHGKFTEEKLVPVARQLAALLADEGISLLDFYYCPHAPDGSQAAYAGDCTCRKPLPGMLHRAADEHGIDLARSWMVGDILNDIEAGRRAGCRTVLIDNGNETEWQRGPLREPDAVAVDLLEAAQTIAHLSGTEAAVG